MFRVVICSLLLFIYMYTIVDQLPRLGKRELIGVLLFTCKYVVSVWRGFLFFWVLGMGYVILLWHSLSLPLIILLKNRSVSKKSNEYADIRTVCIQNGHTTLRATAHGRVA